MVNYFRRAHLPYRQAVEHGILTVRAADGGRSLEFFRTEDPRYPEATELVRWVMARGGADALCELYVVGRFLAEGPKFFAFDARTCEALEQFSLALPARDYAQPFPTLLIRLPPDYAQDRVAPFAHLGRAGTHTPDWIFVRHDQATGRVLILTHMTSDTYLTKSLCTNQDESLEAAWEEAHRVRSDDSPSSLPVTPGEIELNHAMSRLALATCLLLLVYGTKRVGPDNPSHGDRLKRHLDRARKSRDTGRIALAAWDLDTLPVRYAFA